MPSDFTLLLADDGLEDGLEPTLMLMISLASREWLGGFASADEGATVVVPSSPGARPTFDFFSRAESVAALLALDSSNQLSTFWVMLDVSETLAGASAVCCPPHNPAPIKSVNRFV